MLEKIFTVLSLILIVAVIGYLIKESISTETPPAFQLEQADPIKRGQFTAVDVFIENVGDQSAKAVNITGEIAVRGQEPLKAEATLDWLPGRSTRQTTLLFPGDTPTTKPQVEVVGYEIP